MLKRMHGLHLTSDFRGCAHIGAAFWSAQQLRDHCLAAVRQAGLMPVGEIFHAFGDAGAGVTGVVLLAESHLAVHTWPELCCATADVYVCNFGRDNTARAWELMRAIEAPFQACEVERHQLERGARPLSRPATRWPTLSPSEKASSKTE